MAITPYMTLSLPTPSVTAGPAWATMLNDALTLVDAHNHASGSGVQIPTSGININADFPLNSYNVTQTRSLRLSSQVSPLALATDATCVYVSGGDLYYNNSTGTPVQITSGSSLSASSLGGISGLSGSTGTASFSQGSGTFTWQSNTNVGAIMDFGPLVTRSQVTGFGITLQSPNALPANYTITLPSAAPASTLPLSMASNGQLSNGQITRAQIVSVGEQTATLAGSFTTTLASAVTVTGLSVTLTTSGRPVAIFLMPNTAGTPMDIFGGAAGMRLFLNRDAAAKTWFWNTATTQRMYPTMVLDSVTAGTHTYIVQLASNTAGQTSTISAVTLVAYEL